MPELFPDLYSREMGMSGFADQMSKDARHLLVVASADATKSARVPDVNDSIAIAAGSRRGPERDYKTRTTTGPATLSRLIGEFCRNKRFAVVGTLKRVELSASYAAFANARSACCAD